MIKFRSDNKKRSFSEILERYCDTHITQKHGKAIGVYQNKWYTTFLNPKTKEIFPQDFPR